VHRRSFSKVLFTLVENTHHDYLSLQTMLDAPINSVPPPANLKRETLTSRVIKLPKIFTNNSHSNKTFSSPISSFFPRVTYTIQTSKFEDMQTQRTNRTSSVVGTKSNPRSIFQETHNFTARKDDSTDCEHRDFNTQLRCPKRWQHGL